MTPRFRKFSVGLVITIAILVLTFRYPQYGYGEGLAFVQGASSKVGDRTRVFDPVVHLSEIKEILLSRGFVEIPTERVYLPKVPVLADGTSGYLEASFRKRNIFGSILDAKVYSTENHDIRIIGVRSVYRDATMFDSWYFHREQDILFKQTRELQRKLFNEIFRTGQST